LRTPAPQVGAGKGGPPTSQCEFGLGQVDTGQSPGAATGQYLEQSAVGAA